MTVSSLMLPALSTAHMCRYTVCPGSYAVKSYSLKSIFSVPSEASDTSAAGFPSSVFFLSSSIGSVESLMPVINPLMPDSAVASTMFDSTFSPCPELTAST